MRQKSFIAKALLSAHNARSVVSIGVISHLCSAVCCLFVSAMNSFRIFFWFMWLHRGAPRRQVWRWRVGSVRRWGARYYGVEKSTRVVFTAYKNTGAIMRIKLQFRPIFGLGSTLLAYCYVALGDCRLVVCFRCFWQSTSSCEHREHPGA